jgi:hypothetical protein
MPPQASCGGITRFRSPWATDYRENTETAHRPSDALVSAGAVLRTRTEALVRRPLQIDAAAPDSRGRSAARVPPADCLDKPPAGAAETDEDNQRGQFRMSLDVGRPLRRRLQLAGRLGLRRPADGAGGADPKMLRHSALRHFDFDRLASPEGDGGRAGGLFHRRAIGRRFSPHGRELI